MNGNACLTYYDLLEWGKCQVFLMNGMIAAKIFSWTHSTSTVHDRLFKLLLVFILFDNQQPTDAAKLQKKQSVDIKLCTSYVIIIT